MLVLDSAGRVFTVKPMYGTWGEVRNWDKDIEVDLMSAEIEKSLHGDQ
jgi:hypothetical protein